MSEQRVVPEIPEDLREMNEASKLDTTTFVGSEIRQLIERIAALTAERDALKQQLISMTNDRNLWQDAHDEDCPNKAENATLKAQVERLDWQPITPQNLPKVGDEVISGDSILVIDSEGYFTRLTYRGWKKDRFTHFRPTNPPARTAPAKETE